MVDRNSLDFTDISELTTLNGLLDGLTEDEINSNDWETQLCIPQDRLEDIEFFPNFNDDLISLGKFLLTPELKESPYSSEEIKSIMEPEEENAEAKTLISEDSFDEGLSAFSVSNLKHEFEPMDSGSTLEVSSHNGNKKLGNVLGVNLNKGPRSKRTKRNTIWNLLVPLLPKKNQKLIEKRRCKHCETEETPQWRMGPMGPKTLCNACGVRYKSGRLLPEYRPAASPTFNNRKHSNFHRRIMQKKLCEEVVEKYAGEVIN